MGRLGRIALWEWGQLLRQWSFVVSLLLPLALVGLFRWIAQGTEKGKPVVVAVWDETGRWLRWLHEFGSEAVGQPLVVYPLTAADSVAWGGLLKRVELGQWGGIVRLRPTSGGVEAHLWSRSSVLPLMRALLSALEQHLRAETVYRIGLPEAVGQQLLRPIVVFAHPLPAEVPLRGQVFLSVVGLLLLSHALLWAARSLTEERFSRVAELLVSIVGAGELVVGKFVGLSGIGVAQIAVFIGFLGSLGQLEAGWISTAGVLVVSYCFMAALGLWMAVRARSEPQLHGYVVLALVGLSVGPIVAVGWEPLGSVLLLVPLWIPWGVWLRPTVGTELLLGVGMSLVLTAALLRDTAASVHRLIAPPAR